MKNPLVIFVLVLSLSCVSCAGRNLNARYNTPVSPRGEKTFSFAQLLVPQQQGQYQPEMEEITADEKMGGALIGLIGAGVAAALIAVPIILLTR